MTKGIHRLREARTRKGWTMEDLAQRSGVSWRTIQRIETGHSFPHRPTRDALARALKADADDLFSLEEVS